MIQVGIRNRPGLAGNAYDDRRVSSNLPCRPCLKSFGAFEDAQRPAAVAAAFENQPR